MEEEEIFDWYYRSDNDPLVMKTKGAIWTKYPDCELIENCYNDYLYLLENDSENINENSSYKLEEMDCVVDFIYNLHISSDKSDQRLIGRFKGNPNKDQTLENTLVNKLYRWFFIVNNDSSNEIVWAPYKIDDNDKIDDSFKKYYLSKGPPKYVGENFEIDFINLIETNSENGTTKRVGRFINCPKNLTRFNYYNNNIRPKVSQVNILNKESLKYIKKDFSLNFKNIFPVASCSENKVYTFYHNSKTNQILLHLSYGWYNPMKLPRKDITSTENLINEKIEEGFNIMCKIERDENNLINTHLENIPPNLLRCIFKANWYRKLDEKNDFLWIQYSYDVNSSIENEYKKKYLAFGDLGDIEIAKHCIKVNFSNNTVTHEDKLSSIIRFYIKYAYPDNITSINIPEEVFSKVNLENEKKRLQHKEVNYANKYGPKNLNELIHEITNEIKREGNKLNSSEESKSYLENYIANMMNSNFVFLIIKMYTEEGFLYRRINKIMRDQEYEEFWDLKYYYFSLLYCLKKSKSITSHKVLYRGMKLRQDQTEFYHQMKSGQMILFNEFLSTTYDKSIAQKYAGKESNSYLIEINIPEDSEITCIERFSRFEHEREILLVSGSILEFKKIQIDYHENYYVLTFDYISSNKDAFCKLLSSFKKNVDLTSIDMDINEINYIFSKLDNIDNIEEIEMKIFDQKTIPYIAKKIALNKSLRRIKLTRNLGQKSIHKIIYHREGKKEIELNFFTENDFSLFIPNLLDKLIVEEIFFYNYNEKSFKLLDPFLSKNLNLKKIELSTSEIRNSENIIEMLRGLKRADQNLKQLYLYGFYLSSDSFNVLSKLIEINKSIENLYFCIDNDDSSNLFEFPEKLKNNKVIKDITISIENESIKSKNVIKYEQGILNRSISLNNFSRKKLKAFITSLFNNNSEVVLLNLSCNQISLYFAECLNEILIQLNNLTTLDLSNNIICDSIIKYIYPSLSVNESIKFLNLSNNILTDEGYILLSKLNPSKELNLNFNFITKDWIMKENYDEDSLEFRSIKTIKCEKKVDRVIMLLLNDGNIATCWEDFSIKIWDTNDNFKCLYTLTGHDYHVRSLLKLNDGKIVSHSFDSTLRVWDPKLNYKCVIIKNLEYSNLIGYLDRLIELPNGNIFSLYSNCNFRIFNPKDDLNYVQEKYDDNLLHISSIEVLKNGKLALSSVNIKIMDPSNNFDIIQIIDVLEGEGSVSSLLELPNGKLLSGANNLIKVLDINENYQCFSTLKGHQGNIKSFVYLERGIFASGSDDKSIKIWDIDNNYICIHTLSDFCESVVSLLYLKEGKLISGSNDFTFKIWDKERNKYKCVQTLTEHNYCINSIIELPNRLIVSGSTDETIKIWNPKDNNNCITTLKEESSVFKLVGLDSNRFASSIYGNNFKIWDKEDNNYKYFEVSNENLSGCEAVCVCSDGKIISLKNRILSVFDSKNNFDLITQFGDNELCLEILYDGKISTGSYDYTIKIWDPYNNFSVSQVLKGHINEVISLKLHSSKKLISASRDTSIKIWDPDNLYNCIFTINAHINDIYCLAELPDGKIVSGSFDKTIKIWDCEDNYNCVQCLEGHEEGVKCLLVNSDGNLYSGSLDKTIKVWKKK